MKQKIDGEIGEAGTNEFGSCCRNWGKSALFGVLFLSIALCLLVSVSCGSSESEELQTVERGVWQPLMRLEQTPGEEHVELVIESFTRGAEVRYTLDGSLPERDSRLYTEPLHIDGPVDVKAKAFTQDNLSPLASYSVRSVHDFEPVPPDAPDLVNNLKLWLSAYEIAEHTEHGEPLAEWKAVVGPDAEVPDAELTDGRDPKPPTFSENAINGWPTVRFRTEEAQLAIAGFTNDVMAGGPFTVLFLSRSDDSSFGLSGNNLVGAGGVPRLYMTRGQFHYDVHSPYLSTRAPHGTSCVIGFRHDGINTAATYLGGRKTAERDDAEVVESFGSGNLAMPFWSGNQPRKGDISEVIVYDKALTPDEIEKVSVYIGRRYGITRMWTLE